jgi:hypothetical protein
MEFFCMLWLIKSNIDQVDFCPCSALPHLSEQAAPPWRRYRRYCGMPFGKWSGK